MTTNAYLFTGWFTQVRDETHYVGRGIRKTSQVVDGCSSLIVYGGDAEQTRKRFEEWLLGSEKPDSVTSTQIGKIVSAPMLEQLLAESGETPADWRKISEQIQAELESTPADDFEQGYWVDVNETVRPEGIGPDIERLHRDLPDDIRSGLNWSADKQFFFLLSVLSPPPPPPPDPYEMEADVPNRDEAARENCEKPQFVEVGLQQMDFPELLGKELAVLVQARNSVVAAWLWRRRAVNTPLAANAIRIDPWCGAMGLDENN